jgi:hypothetical protein
MTSVFIPLLFLLVDSSVECDTPPIENVDARFVPILATRLIVARRRLLRPFLRLFFSIDELHFSCVAHIE